MAILSTSAKGPVTAVKNRGKSPATQPAAVVKEAPDWPFKDPLPLRMPDWDEESLGGDYMTVLLSAPGGVTSRLDDILKNDALPVLAITGTLYRELRYMVEKHASSELALFMTLKRAHAQRPHFLATDMFMPGQSVSSGGVELDSDDCERYFSRLKGVPYYRAQGLHRHLCHVHSHGRMGAFWSSTDDTQQLSREDLGYKDAYRFYLVVNAAGDLKCSLVSYTPTLHRTDAAVALQFSRPEYAQALTRARKKELDVLTENMMCAQRVGYEPLSSWTGDWGWRWPAARTAQTSRGGTPPQATLRHTPSESSVRELTDLLHSVEVKPAVFSVPGMALGIFRDRSLSHVQPRHAEQLLLALLNAAGVDIHSLGSLDWETLRDIAEEVLWIMEKHDGSQRDDSMLQWVSEETCAAVRNRYGDPAKAFALLGEEIIQQIGG